MDIEDQFNLNHLFLNTRKCRKCGETKNLIEGFYRTRKDRGQVVSSYSYICKQCTIFRVINDRKTNLSYNPVPRIKDVYPDW